MALEFLNGIKIPAGEINLKGLTIERASGNGATGFDNDALGSYILSPTDGSWGAGTKPAGSHNGVGILSFQTHTGNYYTQLALSTNTNDLFIRSANASETFGDYSRLWNDSHFSTTNVTNWNTAYGWGDHDGLYLPIGGGDVTGDIEIKKTDPKLTFYDNSGANGTPNGEIVFAELDGYENFKVRYNGASDRFEYWGLISSTSTLVGYWNRSTDTSLHSVGTISTGSDGDSTDWKTAYDHSQATHAPTDAEANVQADWTETTVTDDAYIKNKPTTFAPSAHNHTSLTGVTNLTFAAQSSDSASITTTIDGTHTYFDFNLTDDNNNDWWRWRFTPSGSTLYDAMVLKPASNGNANLTVSGNVTADNIPTSYAPTDAEANVQADWTETTDTDDAYIKNKPSTFPPSTHNHDGRYLRTHARYSDDLDTITTSGVYIWDVSEADDEPTGAADGLLTIKYWDSSFWATASFQDFHNRTLHIKSKKNGTWQTDWAQVWTTDQLTTTNKTNYDTAYTHSQAAHAPTDAEANVQADWNETTTTSDAFIQNKPTIPTDHGDHDGLYIPVGGGQFSGALDFTPDTGAILKVDNQTILERTTANGGLTIGHDDSIILAGGDTSGTMNSNINNGEETVFIGAEGGLKVFAFPDNLSGGWSARKEWRFQNNGITTFPGDASVGTAKYTLTVNAPSGLTTTIVNSTINVTFTASTTTNIDYYLVFSSVDGGDYGLISVIPPADFGATMSIIDDSFDATGTQAYRVYAVKNGVYSSPLTGSKSYSVTAPLEPTNMSVVNLNKAYYVQWDPPSANVRFVTAYSVYKHEHATQSSLSRSSATLIYSGLNTSYMYQISGANNGNFHQFWVETTIA
jgi:hypothetical protein